jgi:hypothetical protein
MFTFYYIFMMRKLSRLYRRNNHNSRSWMRRIAKMNLMVYKRCEWWIRCGHNTNPSMCYISDLGPNYRVQDLYWAFILILTQFKTIIIILVLNFLYTKPQNLFIFLSSYLILLNNLLKRKMVNSSVHILFNVCSDIFADMNNCDKFINNTY